MSRLVDALTLPLTNAASANLKGWNYGESHEEANSSARN